MKRLLSLTLSAIIVAGAFVSCAQTKSYSPKITVSSSDAASDAEYLTNRLGVLKDSVHLGIGSDEFDMTDFENDGYIIRSSGGEVVIIGATAEGLTNGVRKYANHAESGTAGELDISYHEGYRVEKFTLAGVDISEYAIEYPESYNENMKFAVSEFAKLTERACGVKLRSSVGITDRKYAIEFRHIDEIQPKKHSYRYFFEGNRFVIEGTEEQGCMFGVYRFFKKELDWMGLTHWDGSFYPDSVLAESEAIHISADTFREESSAFQGFQVYTGVSGGRKSDAKVSNFYKIQRACHGLQGMNLGDYDVKSKQLCYSDDEQYECVFEAVSTYARKQVDSGKIIGVNFNYIDISQGDNADHCLCNECMKVFKAEGDALSGIVVRFANRLSDDMDAAGFEGLNYLIFAYAGTQKPPKTVPYDNVYTTLCYDGSCSAHPIATGDCPYNMIPDYMTTHKNSDFAAWTKGWGKITENLDIWYYILDHTVDQYTVLKNLYDDVKFLAECNVRGLFFESETGGLGMNWISLELMDEMNWDTDMTREEYEGYLCRILEKEFGDGWREIREYMDYWQEAQDRSGYCFHCWGFGFTYHVGQYEYDYVADKYDYLVYLVDQAIDLACDAREIRNCELFAVHVLYQGCLSSYFKEYDEGDSERIALLSERYGRMMDILRKYNLYNEEGGTYKSAVFGGVRLYDTLEAHAWNEMVKIREFLPCGEVVRDAPEK